MAGQAAVTVNSNQWNVWVASTYAELTNGLRGRDSIPPGTGMLFVLPSKQAVSVDTREMSFPIDVIFISESTVVDVASNIQPDYLVTEETPCDMFLEVNAGEAAGVGVGDTVSTATIQQPGFDWSQITSFAIPLAVLGFVCAMAGGMAKLMGGSSRSSSPSLAGHSSPGRLKPQIPEPWLMTRTEWLADRERTSIAEGFGWSKEGEAHAAQLHKRAVRNALAADVHVPPEVLKDYPDLVEREYERGRELSVGSSPSGHSMWLTAEQRKELEKKYGMVAVRWAEEATRPGDIKAAEAAAEYYYRKIKEAFGLGHLSPELSEEQIRKLRDLLGLPEEVPPREKGYIDDNRAWVKAIRKASY